MTIQAKNIRLSSSVEWGLKVSEFAKDQIHIGLFETPKI